MRNFWSNSLVMFPLAALILLLFSSAAVARGKQQKTNAPPSSYAPVVSKEDFATTLARMKKEKPQVMKRQMDLLTMRYNLANQPAKGVTMSRGKPIQEIYG